MPKHDGREAAHAYASFLDSLEIADTFDASDKQPGANGQEIALDDIFVEMGDAARQAPRGDLSEELSILRTLDFFQNDQMEVAVPVDGRFVHTGAVHNAPLPLVFLPGPDIEQTSSIRRVLQTENLHGAPPPPVATSSREGTWPLMASPMPSRQAPGAMPGPQVPVTHAAPSRQSWPP